MGGPSGPPLILACQGGAADAESVRAPPRALSDGGGRRPLTEPHRGSGRGRRPLTMAHLGHGEGAQAPRANEAQPRRSPGNRAEPIPWAEGAGGPSPSPIGGRGGGVGPSLDPPSRSSGIGGTREGAQAPRDSEPTKAPLTGYGVADPGGGPRRSQCRRFSPHLPSGSSQMGGVGRKGAT